MENESKLTYGSWEEINPKLQINLQVYNGIGTWFDGLDSVHCNLICIPMHYKKKLETMMFFAKSRNVKKRDFSEVFNLHQ